MYPVHSLTTAVKVQHSCVMVLDLITMLTLIIAFSTLLILITVGIIYCYPMLNVG